MPLYLSGSLIITGSVSTAPSGSFPIGSSIGTLAADQSNLSGSLALRYLPEGYQAYFIYANESDSGTSKLYLYRTTTNGFTNSVPSYTSPITVINKEYSNTAWLAVNPSDSGVSMNITAGAIASHSMAPGTYANLLLDTSDSFAPKWRLYSTGSIY